MLTPQGAVFAVAYFATAKDPMRLPYDWYKASVLQGAFDHEHFYMFTVSPAFDPFK